MLSPDHLVASPREARGVGGRDDPELAAFAVVVAQDDHHYVAGPGLEGLGAGQCVEPEHRALDQVLEGANGHLCLLRVDRCDTRSNALLD